MTSEVELNAQLLLSVVSKLVEADREHGLTAALNEFQSSLTELVSNPTQRDCQNRVAERLNHLQKAFSAFDAELTPADMARLEDLRGGRFFSSTIVQVFRRSIAENAITPAIITDQLSRFLEERGRFLQTLENTEQNLKALGVEQEHFEVGLAEVGFLVPRALFSNRLKLLVAELATTNHLIRVFSETATGSIEEAELHEISTSDPTFFFGVSIPTALVVAKAVKWALETWQALEDVRRVRAETKRLNLLTEEELTATFDSKIQQRIETAIKSYAQEVLTIHTGGSRSRREQERHLEWALDSVLTRVDRGMTVEIKFSPPPAARTHAPLEGGHAMSELVQLQSQLLFPRTSHEPVRGLPPGGPPHSEDEPPLEPAQNKSSKPQGLASEPTDEVERRLPPAEPLPSEIDAPLEPARKKVRKAHGSAPRSGNGGR
jgi:hypothetical protein